MDWNLLNRRKSRRSRRGNAERKPRRVLLELERLEIRWLMDVGIKEFAVPTLGSYPFGLTAGPDGNLWFTEQHTQAGQIGKITTAGAVTEYGLPFNSFRQLSGITSGPNSHLWFDEAIGTGQFPVSQTYAVGETDTSGNTTEHGPSPLPTNLASSVGAITVGPDGNLWFGFSWTAPPPGTSTGVSVVTMTPSGTFTQYDLSNAGQTAPPGIAAGSDRNLWVTVPDANEILRMTTSGNVTGTFTLASGSSPYGITAGPDGNLWFTEAGSNKIGRITTAGDITEFTIPTANSQPHGITAGPDGGLWFTESAANQIGHITTSGTIAEFAGLTAGSSPESIATGPDKKIWFTEPGSNQIGRLDWVLQAGVLQFDPVQGQQVPIAFQPGSWFSPNTGLLHVEAPLQFTLAPSLTCGCNPSLIYNSDSVNVQPVVVAQLMGVLGDSTPTSLEAQLTWDNGTPQAWVNITPGPANSFYSFALQVSSPVTKTWAYPFQIEVKATLPDTSVIDRILTGYAPVVVNDGNGGSGSDPVDPFGPGWTVGGVDRLVQVTGQTGVPDGILYVYGQGQSRYFVSMGNGSYLSPPNDMGTLTSNGTSYQYVSKQQIKYNFDSTGKLTSINFPQGISKTFSYSGNLLSNITEPDGGVGTFVYTGGLLTSIQEPGSRTVTVGRTAGGGGLSDLTSLTFPDNSLRTFSYDPQHRLLSDSRWPLSASYAYDSTAGVLSTITLAGGFLTFAVKPAFVQELKTGVAWLDSTPDLVTDAQNNTTTFVEDLLSRLLGETTADGASMQWTLDFAGDPTTVVDQLNRVTTYAYIYGSGLGDLTQVTYPDGTSDQYQYDPTWHEPTVEVDALGNRTTMTYDPGTGNLLTQTDALGRVTSYTYYSGGLVQSVTDPNNNVTSYAYDGNRHVTEEIDGYGSPAATTTTMIYDAMGDLVSQTSGIASSNAHPVTTSYAYDALGRILRTIEGYGTPVQATTTIVYDNAGDELSITDPNGNVTSYGYDAAGRVAQEIDGFGTPAATTATMIYDSRGNLLSETTGQSSLATYAHLSTTSYGYDALNRLTQVIEGYGSSAQRTSSTSYNLTGNVLSTTDPNGNVTSYAYDVLNRVVKVITGYGTAVASTATMIYDSVGNLLSETTGQSTTLTYANPSTTSYAYDALNRVIQTIQAYGTAQQRSSSTAFDAAGNELSTTDPNGNVTSYGYDALNRVVKVITAYGTAVAATATMIYDATSNLLSETTGQSVTLTYAQPSTTSYAYDARNRLTQQIDGYGTPAAATMTMIYDSRGNLLSETTGQSSLATYAHLATTSYGYDPLNRRTQEIDAYGTAQQRTLTTVYDAAGDQVVSIDGAGNATTITYDALGRPVTTLDPLGHLSTTVYDAVGNRVNTIDANGNKSTYTFDALNRPVTAVDPRGATTTTVYDAAGNQVNLIDADNNKTTFVFNALNQMVQQIDPLGHGATYAYDLGGRLTSATDRDGRVRNVSYDALNRETGETWVVSGTTTNTLTFTYDARGNQLTAADGNGAYTIAYDALGRPTSEQEPFGLTLTFTYDAASDRTLRQDSFGGVLTSAYDALARLTSRQFGGSGQTALHVALTWTSEDQLATLSRYNDQGGSTLVGTSSYVYDAAQRIMSIQHSDGSGHVLASYAYGYDAGDRLTSQVVDGTTTTFSYDQANQLTQAGSATYSYDATGNRTMAGYQTGAGNQLTNDGTWTYTYDAEGNLVKKSKGASAETWTYGYDLHNHMVWAKDQATDGGTTLTLATYVYDVYGNRLEEDIWTQSSGTTTVSRSGYDGSNAWVDLSGANQLVMRRLFLDGANQVFARIDGSGTAAWYLPDREGSVRDVVNFAGTVVLDRVSYDSYGNVTGETNASAGDAYKYNGGRLDSATGLTLFDWRYYDAATGRWVTQDPTGFAAGDPNTYRYAGNDPTNLIDPSGLMPNKDGAVKLNAVISTVWEYERLHPGNPAEVFTGLTDYYAHHWSYLYTTKRGWIDLKHFFEAATWTAYNVAPTVVELAGITIEYAQTLAIVVAWPGGYGSSGGNSGSSGSNGAYHSAFTVEDLPSNDMGIEFARGLTPCGTITSQLQSYLKSLGATDPPIGTPAYDDLPQNEEEWAKRDRWSGPIRRAFSFTTNFAPIYPIVHWRQITTDLFLRPTLFG